MRVVLPLVLMAAITTAELRAQDLPVHLTGRLGLMDTDPAHGPGCEYVYPAAGVEVRSKGTWQLVATADFYGAGGGSDVGCFPSGLSTENTIDYAEGGLELDRGGASRFTMGAAWGRRTTSAGIDLTLGAGVTRANSVSGDFHPWVGGVVGVSFLKNHLVIAWDQGWNRVPTRHEIHPWPPPHTQDNPPPQPGEEPFEIRETHSWGRISGLWIGLRY